MHPSSEMGASAERHVHIHPGVVGEAFATRVLTGETHELV